MLLPLPFDAPFDYGVPEGMTVAAGDYVRVPFGRKELVGVVWGAAEGSLAAEKVKPLREVIARVPPMRAELRGFIDWVADYTLSPRGMVLKMALSAPEALEPAASVPLYFAAGVAPKSAARQRVAALLADGRGRLGGEIQQQAAVSAAVLRAMAQAGELRVEQVESRPVAPAPFAPKLAALSPLQARAAEELAAKVEQGFSVTLLDGVTGSGKTEVYFDTIARVLVGGGERSFGFAQDTEEAVRSSQDNNERGQHTEPLVAEGVRLIAEASRRKQEQLKKPALQAQVLILLPEIALSVQWLERFTRRFGVAPVVWHSGVSPARKREAWRAVARGEARLVVGARSALFLPFARLSLLVVDEEHEAAYKQEDGVMYQARDMAVLRGQMEGCPVVLASATPSLETQVNVQRGKYAELTLPARHGVAELPPVEIVDMRLHNPGAGHWISAPLRVAVEVALAAGNQAMLFLNRRGYAPLLLCRNCGFRYACPHCSAWLVEHRAPHRLQCHHCDFRRPFPAQCDDCQTPAGEALVACGPGVERLAAEAAELFPKAKIAQMTSDSVQSPQQAEAVINGMASCEINLLIGTQMMAKGHHFPGLALVGVVDADLGLAGGDLRATERSWQLLHQVAGRAGREGVAGRVLLQTYLPEHPVMVALAAHDRDGFMALEQAGREQAGMPPFGRLAALIVEGPNEAAAKALAQQLARKAPDFQDVQILGPAPAPLALLRGHYRYRLLVKTPRGVNMQKLLRDWLAQVPVPSALRVKMDVDPYSFM